MCVHVRYVRRCFHSSCYSLHFPGVPSISDGQSVKVMHFVHRERPNKCAHNHTILQHVPLTCLLYTDLPVLSVTEQQLLLRLCGVEPKQSSVVLIAYVIFLKDAHHGITWRSSAAPPSSFATSPTGPRWTRLTLERLKISILFSKIQNSQIVVLFQYR